MQKQLITMFIVSCLLPDLSNALTFFRPNRDPVFIHHQANPYEAGNPYFTTNHNNPYSEFRSPYDPGSVFNNETKYGARTYDSLGNFQGVLGQHVDEPNSIINPYGHYGNVYNNDNVRNPYNGQNANNPYSASRSPYDPTSVFNKNKYQKLYDNHYFQH